jgi:hypothetical protein
MSQKKQKKPPRAKIPEGMSETDFAGNYQLALC